MPQVHSIYTCPETGKEKKGTFFIASERLFQALRVKKQFRVVGKNVFVCPKPDAANSKEKALLTWICSQNDNRSLKEVQEEIRRRTLSSATTWTKASPAEEKKYRETVAQIRKAVEAYVKRQYEFRRKQKCLALGRAIHVLSAHKCVNVDQARARIAELSTKL